VSGKGFYGDDIQEAITLNFNREAFSFVDGTCGPSRRNNDLMAPACQTTAERIEPSCERSYARFPPNYPNQAHVGNEHCPSTPIPHSILQIRLPTFSHNDAKTFGEFFRLVNILRDMLPSKV
jgi:hypothetical protein